MLWMAILHLKCNVCDDGTEPRRLTGEESGVGKKESKIMTMGEQQRQGARVEK